MSDIVYLYDGSFDGFLCCIFESYAKKEVLTDIFSDEDFEPILFATRTIQTDPAHARRVFRGIAKRSPYAVDLVRRGFLTCLEDREMKLYHLIVKLIQNGPGFLHNLTDDILYPVWKSVRFLGEEAEKYRGFLRFSEFSGVLGAEISPKNQILPLLRKHFCNRYQNEKFFIYDQTHREILLYANRKATILPIEHFKMASPDEKEVSYRLLWKRFYEAVAIQERFNPKCRMSHMPKRYWKNMTEFQGPEFFRADTPSAVSEFLSVPAGKPELEKHAEPSPPAPESDP